MSPYLIDTPAVVSFSGGRTSGFMLRKIIDAFGGTLPDDVRVCFANTGLEHPKTYEFVEAVERNWNVPIHWLEYTGPKEFREVRPDTASRRGEPFSELLLHMKVLPNPISRNCTAELKIRTIRRFVESLGVKEHTVAIGLRADEQKRVSRTRNDRSWEDKVMPMAEAGHTLSDVLEFWRSQPFDLDLPGGDNAYGNCVGCFLKAKPKLLRIARAEPHSFDWWIEAERRASERGGNPQGARFRQDRPRYIDLLWIAKNQGMLFSEHDEHDTIDCACTD